jgi:ABC-2 type transport system ATP-binding protein
MTHSLEFKSVSKVFKKRGQDLIALNDISFSIAEGEVFGFIGPNGAGKSTTIKVMLDIISNYTGEATIFGKSARSAESRKDVAYVPESPALYEQLTPLEILKTALSMYGSRQKNHESWCMNWLEQFTLTEYANKRIKHLSKGNIQRVALAHALVVSPKLLILDEPLSGLDPVGRKNVIDILINFKNNGGSIFFTSHVLYDVERIADRFGFINAGKLVTTREPRDLVSKDSNQFIIRYHTGTNGPTAGTVLRSGEFEYVTTQSELPSMIDEINNYSGRIISIKPALSLENVFFQILEESTSERNS